MGSRTVGRRLVLAAPAAVAVTQVRAASPVALSVIDVAGNLQLTKTGIERFRTGNPGLVSRITYTQAPSPELPGKIKAQQDAGRVDIDLVLTGPGALSDGITQNLWEEVLPRHGDVMPDLSTLFSPGARMMQENFGRGRGIAVGYSPSGPLFEYAPGKVTPVPRTPEDLLGWVRAHPNRFTYARPLNSGPGWTWLQGLPYLLGDKDPGDPVNGWDKSWTYLAALGQGIDYYPPGTAAMMKELADNTRDMVVSTCGWDINPRVLGVVPKEMAVFMLDGTRWLPDTQFMAIPRGVAAEKLPVLLQLMAFMLRPEQQADTYDRGYFYPGPVLTGVPLSAAPAESQAALRDFGRPEYDQWIAQYPVATPLPPDRLVAAFRRWDEQIGAKSGR